MPSFSSGFKAAICKGARIWGTRVQGTGCDQRGFDAAGAPLIAQGVVLLLHLLLRPKYHMCCWTAWLNSL